MNYPQQPGPPQQQYPQQPGPPQQSSVGSLQDQAMQQVWDQNVHEAPRGPAKNRDKPHDGDHKVQFLHDTELKVSQNDGRLFLLVSYTVLESTVPSMVGNNYALPMYMSNKYQLEDLQDVAKHLWGVEAVAQWSQQRVQFKDIVAAIPGAIVNQYGMLNTRRNTKKGSVSYEDAFPNHRWSYIGPAYPQDQLQSSMAPQGGEQPQQPAWSPPAAPQAPQAPQQPQQAPQQPGPPPGVPGQPQQLQQPPQPQQQAPQQPGPPPGVPGQPQQPQQPPQPQQPQQAPQQPGPPPGMASFPDAPGPNGMPPTPAYNPHYDEKPPF